MEQLVFLLVFAALAIGKWALDRATSKREEESADPRQPRWHGEDEEEKMRRFVEALGQPAQKQPQSAPPPVQPQPKPKAKKQRSQVELGNEGAGLGFAPSVEAAPIHEIAPALAVQRPITWNRAGAGQKSALMDSLDLQTPAALRKAVILREILGTPKGLTASTTI